MGLGLLSLAMDSTGCGPARWGGGPWGWRRSRWGGRCGRWAAPSHGRSACSHDPRDRPFHPPPLCQDGEAVPVLSAGHRLEGEVEEGVCPVDEDAPW